MTCKKSRTFADLGTCLEQCYCDRDVYPHTSQSCTGYYQPAGEVCNDGHTDYYKLCEDHTCDYRTHNMVNEEWGCMQAYIDCASKCEIPYVDNCHAREDNLSQWGCDKYWEDCPSKCEEGTICTPADCSGFALTEVPPNSKAYDTCTVGCGDNVTRFKIGRAHV